MPIPIRNVKQRFLEKVQKTDSCWIWKAQIMPEGYGNFWINGRNCGAHRASWKIFIGEIPKGMFVCHHCDVKSCVNPEHLFLGTCKDNVLDMVGKGLRAVQNPLLQHYDDILEKYLNGATAQEIAQEYGVCAATVFKIIRRQIPKIPGSFRKNNRQLKLTEEQVLDIKRQHVSSPRGKRSPFNQSSLAKKYGVTQDTIHKIITGKTWRHVS